VSRNGGKDNVSAACMEVSDQGRAILLRVSRNEGVNEPMILDLKPILQVMTQNTSAGMFKFSDHVVHIPHRPWSD
jgi:hypothetical protein